MATATPSPSGTTIAAALPHNAVLAVSGDDAAAFLHGQLTNDVEALRPGDAQWNGWLTAKGRMLASFLLVRRSGDCLLMLPAEIAEAVAKRMRMFVLRSKVKIEDASAGLTRIGLAGPGAEALVAAHWGEVPEPMRSVERDGALAVRLDAERFVVIAPADQGAALQARLAGAGLAGPESWEAAAIRAGVPTVLAATQEAFIPQMVNFDLIGGVSFRKGCYPGQEIVARTHYRGGLKRRMALAHVDAPQSPRPGDPLYSSAFGEQVAGQVANVAPAPGGGYDALVVAQLESLARDDLRWNSPDGPAARLRSLPYEVPR
jgi:folate-binding protein YgfZ